MTRLLELAPFEESMVVDDREAYPISIVVRLRCRGLWQRAALQSALEQVLGRHPLLCSRARQSERGRWQWEPMVVPATALSWGPISADGRLPPLARIDPTRDFPLQVLALEQGEHAELVVHLHHACADGLGTFQFLGDLVTAYARAAGSDATLPTLDPELLSGRGRFGLTLRRLIRWSPRLAVGLLGARQFLARRPEALIPHEPAADESGLPEGFPLAITHEFTPLESLTLKKTARAAGVTVNDLLARDLFLVLGRWRARRGCSPADGWLRMAVPISLRARSDCFMPAANVVSLVFLDRRPADLVQPAALLKSIHEEMELIKRNRLGLIWVLALALRRRLPGGLAATVKKQGNLATVILTNLGKLLERLDLPRQDGRIVAGGMVVEGADILAPLRRGTCLTVAASSYAGRLIITLHADPRFLTPADTSELLAEYVAQLRSSLAAGGDE